MRFFLIAFVTFMSFCCNLYAQHDAVHKKNVAAKNYKAAANSALDLGDFYKGNRDFEKARNYYNDAYAFGKQSSNYQAAAEANYKLALMEANSNKKSSLNFLKQARNFYSLAGDQAGIAVVAYAAAVLMSDNKYPANQVINAYKEALDASVKVANYKLAMICADMLAKLYADEGNSQMSAFYKKYYNDLYKLANPGSGRKNDVAPKKETLALDNLSDSLRVLQQKYANLDRSSKIALDSILKAKMMQEKQLQHTLDSLEYVKISLEKEQLAKEKLEERAELFTYIYIGSTVFVLIIVTILLIAYTAKRKANRILEAMNAEIIEQKEVISLEKEKADNLLLNILPKETAEELKEKGQATPMQYDKVTVLFTDFKGFTQMSEVLTPAQIVEELNTCFVAFDEICEKYNIEKIKTIGDAYMCAGGIPVANDTNPHDVVMAGLEMMEFMEKLKQEKSAKGELYFEARLGINTGPVITGVVGKKKFAYDLWGDTVNLASRMESSGEVGKVNISENTYNYIKDDFICSYRGKVTAKGKGEIDMYFVERRAY